MTPVSVSITASVASAVIGQQVTFTATAPPAANQVFNWSFGDGAAASGQSVAHAYASSGSFMVLLAMQSSSSYGTASSGMVVSGNSYTTTTSTTTQGTTTQTTTVTGGTEIVNVLNQNNNAGISGAQVSVTGPINVNGYSNGAGQASFVLPTGSYTVTATAPGFGVTTEGFTVSNSGGQATVYLTPTCYGLCPQSVAGISWTDNALGYGISSAMVLLILGLSSLVTGGLVMEYGGKAEGEAS